MTVVHERRLKLRQGALVGSILRKTYWFQRFNQMNAIRQSYRHWLHGAQDESYFQLLRALKSCPGIINQQALEHVQQKLIGQPWAQATAGYYAAVWNDG